MTPPHLNSLDLALTFVFSREADIDFMCWHFALAGRNTEEFVHFDLMMDIPQTFLYFLFLHPHFYHDAASERYEWIITRSVYATHDLSCPCTCTCKCEMLLTATRAWRFARHLVGDKDRTVVECPWHTEMECPQPSYILLDI